MGDIAPREEIARDGMKGLGGVVGGVSLLVLSGLGMIPGLVVGGALTAVGLALATSRDDRLAGGVAAGAGILTILAKALGLGGGLLFIGGIGLLVSGGISLIKFFIKLKARS